MSRALFVLIAFFAAFAPGQAAALDQVYTGCKVESVGAWLNRVHIRCNQPYPTTSIQYFAVPASNRELASRVEAIGLTAQVTGATVYIYFTLADTTGDSIGCFVSDCRLATAVEIHGVGPLASAPVGRLLGPIAAVALPEPGESSGLVASGITVAALGWRRHAAPLRTTAGSLYRALSTGRENPAHTG